MDIEFDEGYAFVLEGDTEKIFYKVLLEYWCSQVGAVLERLVDEISPDVVYLLKINGKQKLLKFHVVNTVTQMPRAGAWFNNNCINKYTGVHKWFAFLCYDKDDYKEDVSKFYEGDWEILRRSLKHAEKVIDMAASADVEDIFLQDIEGVCSFIGIDVPTEIPGKKGKAKLKGLFRLGNKTYHEGQRAEPLIRSLNMERIIDSQIVAFDVMKSIIFKMS